MVHLDFHTGPDVPGVGQDFDRDAFARTFRDADVDSVTVFAKDHHGLLYYDTDRPERHPGLARDLDLMGEQIDALHSVGIRAPIYLSILCDEWAANTHPEWIALDEDLTHVKKFGDRLGAFDAGWQILDMSSPYQDFVAAQIEEVIEQYAPVDGIFLDMCWDQPSSSVWAKAAMKERGMNPADPRARDAFARAVSLEYMQRFAALTEPALHSGSAWGTWFNSRPKTQLHDESSLVRHVEIESLPSGGWGYAYLPYVARFVRPLGLPTLSHTGRFHKSWGDNGALKTRAALLYECAQILSQGATSGIGDLLPPSGMPSPAVYDLIGSVYGHIKECEPFVDGGRLISEIALVMDLGLGDAPGPAGVGAVRVLQQLRQQFDVVGPDADLSDYRLAIVPETTTIDDALHRSLSAYTSGGGAVLVTTGALIGADGSAILAEAGVEVHVAEPFDHAFMRTDPGARGGRFPYDTVMYEPTDRITPIAGAETIVPIVEPYFPRSWDRFSGHEYTPSSGVVSEYAMAVRNGSVVTLAAPVFTAVAVHGNEAYRELVRTAVACVLPRPLVVDDGPAHLEVTVVEVGARTVLHLLSFIPARLAEGFDIVNDAIPVLGMNIRVRRDAAPTTVSLQPKGLDVPFRYVDGYVLAEVSFADGHAMLVLD
jgi:hypothetical protein